MQNLTAARRRHVTWLTRQLITAREALEQRAGSRDRGDVPGWVLITIMTAGLVTLIWGIAGDQLSRMLSSALAAVTGRH